MGLGMDLGLGGGGRQGVGGFENRVCSVGERLGIGLGRRGRINRSGSRYGFVIGDSWW